MDLEQINEINCPICFCMLASPVTLHCGHSFCRQCIINASKDKNFCPICRQDFQSLPNKLKIDLNINKIIGQVQQVKINQQRKERLLMKKTQMESQMQEKIKKDEGIQRNNMLLMDVKTNNLLIPYNKSVVTFELQHPSLLQKLGLFVARQQHPFNNYELLATLISKEQIRYNLYECVILIKDYCKIEEQWVQNGQQNGNQYYYRSCDVKQISEDFFATQQQQLVQQKEKQGQTLKKIHKSNNLQNLWKVHHLLMLILKTFPNKNTVKSLDKIINKDVLIDRNDPLAVYYSIIGIVSIPASVKYQSLCTFNTKKRVDKLIQYFQQHILSAQNDILKFKKGSSGANLLCLHKNSSFGIQIQYLFLIGILLIFIFLYFWGEPDKTTQNNPGNL